MPHPSLATQIIATYALLLLTIATTCMPSLIAQNIGMVTGIAALVWSYMIESKAEKNSAESGHATYLIRTIWIWSLCLLVVFIGAEIVIVLNGNTRAMDDLTLRMIEGHMPSYAELRAAALIFFEDNKDLVLKTLVMWCAPAQLYALLRALRGFERASKGYRLKNPQTWF